MAPDGLRTRLQDWTDADLAHYELAIALDLLDREAHPPEGVKHVFWTANPTSDAMDAILRALVGSGILVGRSTADDDSLDQVRWNPAFRGVWEEP